MFQYKSKCSVDAFQTTMSCTGPKTTNIFSLQLLDFFFLLLLLLLLLLLFVLLSSSFAPLLLFTLLHSTPSLYSVLFCLLYSTLELYCGVGSWLLLYSYSGGWVVAPSGVPQEAVFRHVWTNIKFVIKAQNMQSVKV